VLGDALHRVAVLGGREGMSRSLGSVYGGSVTRFLGGVRGVPRVVALQSVFPQFNGIAVSVDGTRLLVADTYGGSHAIHEFSVADGVALRCVGGHGDGPLHFRVPLAVARRRRLRVRG
jgi:sugar lactone lactonase YvrE